MTASNHSSWTLVTTPSLSALAASLSLYSLPLVVGVAGNTCIIYVILVNPHLRSGVNAYLASMAVLDLLTCAVLVPVRVAFYLSMWPQSRPGPAWPAVCQAEVFLHNLADWGRMLMLAALSLERYQSVASPFHYSRKARLRRALLTLAGLWALSAVYSALQARFFYDTVMFELCISRFHPDTWDLRLWGVIEVYFFLPLSLLTVVLVGASYALIFRLLHQQRQRMDGHSTATNKVGPAPLPAQGLSLSAYWRGQSGTGDSTMDTVLGQDGLPHRDSLDLQYRHVLTPRGSEHRVQSPPLEQQSGDGALLADTLEQLVFPDLASQSEGAPHSGLALTLDVGQLADQAAAAQSGPLCLSAESEEEGTLPADLSPYNGDVSCFEPDHNLPSATALISHRSSETVRPSTAPNRPPARSPVWPLTGRRSSTPLTATVPDCPSLQQHQGATRPSVEMGDWGPTGKVRASSSSRSPGRARAPSLMLACTHGHSRLGRFRSRCRDSVQERTLEDWEQWEALQVAEGESLDPVHPSILSLVGRSLGFGAEPRSMSPTSSDPQPAFHTALSSARAAGGGEKTWSQHQPTESSPTPPSQSVRWQGSQASVHVVDMQGRAHQRRLSRRHNISGDVCLYNRQNRVQGRRRVELHVAQRLLGIFLVFLLLWLPYPLAVLALRLSHLGVVNGRHWWLGLWDQGLATDVVAVLSALSCLVAAVNPLLYGLSNSQIRDAALATLRRLLCRPATSRCLC